MNALDEINDEHLTHIQGGTLLGYTLGWLSRAAFEATHTDNKQFFQQKSN